jgi:hypothetical protein
MNQIAPSIESQLSLPLFRRDSTLYNLVLFGFIFGSILWNREILLNDYPPDVKAKYGPMSSKAKREGYILAVPLFLFMVGVPIWSTLRLKRQNKSMLSFAAAYYHTAGMVMSFWLSDLLLIDGLIGVMWTPSFIVLPGTEGMAGYKDYGLHWRAHLRAAPALAVVSGILALIALTLPMPKSHS